MLKDVFKILVLVLLEGGYYTLKFFNNIASWVEQNKRDDYNTDPKKWNKWWMPLVAFGAFIWFAIRVIPKPSRIRYPCQRAAAPLAMGFVVWFIGFFGMTFTIRGIIRKVKSRNYLSIILLLIVLIAATG